MRSKPKRFSKAKEGKMRSKPKHFFQAKKGKMRSRSKHFSQDKSTKSFRWLSCGVPPVLIPNTEVKPTYTDSTVLETAWEDRQLPDPKQRATRSSRSFAS